MFTKAINIYKKMPMPLVKPKWIQLFCGAGL